MSPLVRWGVLACLLLATASTWMWVANRRDNGDPTYAEDPTRWAGAPGQAAGLHAPIGLPALAARAGSDLHTAEALGLVGTTLAVLQQRLGQPWRLESERDRAVAVWTSAVTVDHPPPDGHPVAHLRIGLRGDGEAAVAVEVSLIGSVGFEIASSGPAKPGGR